jgi:uncharacterized membrane protein
MTQHPIHSEPIEKHPKQDFMVERITFFTDAVVAIAITLLILEIKVPHFTKDTTYAMVMDQLSDSSYGFIALLATFVVISTHWMVHHLLFKHIINYNRMLMGANMFFLFTIIFFPFTTSLFSESADNTAVFSFALKLFFLNNMLTLLSLSAIYWVAFVKNKGFTLPITPAEDKELKNELFFPLIVFSLMLVGSFFTDRIFILLGLNVIMVIGKRIYAFIKKPIKKPA